MRLLFSFSIILVLTPVAAAQEVPAMSNFGKTRSGESVALYKLESPQCTVNLISLGAAIQRWDVKGKETANIVLGFDDVAGYESDANQFFGCTTGRVAGRIARGKFTIDGMEYKVAVNSGPNHLHGGVQRSLDKVVWKSEARATKDGPAVLFSYTSPDGEESYPGNLKIEVLYTLRGNALHIDYTATTDKPTPINLTNHSYFNLAGAGAETVLDHVLKAEADQYVPTTDDLIPTGKLADVKGTPLDFTRATALRAGAEELARGPFKGYDHTLFLRKRDRTPTLAAELTHPPTGRRLKVLTNQPALQVYTGNFLKGQKGAAGKIYRQHGAVCLETQHVPDSVNQPAFPSVVLRPGETYRYTCVYEASND